jgi:DNA-binding transcriptional MerR regulator
MATTLDRKRFYSIGEVAAMLELKPYVLRYWEAEFDQLNPGRGDKSKQRRYQQRDIETLEQIKSLLKEKGLTVAGARNYLSDRGHSSTWDGNFLRAGRAQLKKLATEMRNRKD